MLLTPWQPSRLQTKSQQQAEAEHVRVKAQGFPTLSDANALGELTIYRCHRSAVLVFFFPNESLQYSCLY